MHQPTDSVDADMAAIRRDIRALREMLLAADDLAHEAYRFLHGLEPPDLKRASLDRSYARYRTLRLQYAPPG